MTVWRIARRRFAALDGAGARLYGGRWNRAGQAVVYTSKNLSLAVLEIIVHLEVPADQLPADYVKIAIEIPNEIEFDLIEELPQRARGMLDAGVRWLQSGATVGLLAPSVIIPEEQNLLLNPAHPEFAHITASSTPFTFDRRLFAEA